MKKKLILFLCLLLMAFNFGLQSFDVFSFGLNPCGYYFYDPGCMEISGFIANKVIRIMLNLTCILLLLKNYSGICKTQNFAIVLGLIALMAIDLVFALNKNEFLISIHKILNPVIYSPLLAIVYLSTIVFSPSNWLGKSK